MEAAAAATVPATTVQRALRLLEYQRKASKSYYARNKDAIKAKSIQYWESNRDAINERRRQRYRLTHPKPAGAAPENPQLE